METSTFCERSRTLSKAATAIAPAHMKSVRGKLRALRAVFVQPDPWRDGIHSRRRPLCEWKISVLVFVHHLQEAAERRTGIIKVLCFLLLSLNLIGMFSLGFDVWARHEASDVVRSQLLFNHWDDEYALDDVHSHEDMWAWLQNVWAPAIFPIGASANGSSYSTQVQRNAKATASAPGEHLMLGMNPIIGEPLLCQVKCRPTPCHTGNWKTNTQDEQHCRDEFAAWDTNGAAYDLDHGCHVATIREKWLSAEALQQVYTLDRVKADLAELQHSGWVDYLTCSLQTKLVVFSPQSGIFTIMKVVFALHAGGTVKPNARFDDNLAGYGSFTLTFRASAYEGMLDYLRGILHITAFLIVCTKVVVVVMNLRKGGTSVLMMKLQFETGTQEAFWICFQLLFYFCITTVIAAHLCELALLPNFSRFHVSAIPPFSATLIAAIGYQKVTGQMPSYRCRDP